MPMRLVAIALCSVAWSLTRLMLEAKKCEFRGEFRLNVPLAVLRALFAPLSKLRSR